MCRGAKVLDGVAELEEILLCERMVSGREQEGTKETPQWVNALCSAHSVPVTSLSDPPDRASASLDQNWDCPSLQHTPCSPSRRQSLPRPFRRRRRRPFVMCTRPSRDDPNRPKLLLLRKEGCGRSGPRRARRRWVRPGEVQEAMGKESSRGQGRASRKRRCERARLTRRNGAQSFSVTRVTTAQQQTQSARIPSHQYCRNQPTSSRELRRPTMIMRVLSEPSDEPFDVTRFGGNGRVRWRLEDETAVAEDCCGCG